LGRSGVDLTRQANLTLIGRAKGSRCTALSGVERIIFDSNPSAITEEASVFERKASRGDDA
jgi:FdhD protein